MMPDDLEDDDEFDQNLEEEEDEDSNSYDLTGKLFLKFDEDRGQNLPLF